MVESALSNLRWTPSNPSACSADGSWSICSISTLKHLDFSCDKHAFAVNFGALARLTQLRYLEVPGEYLDDDEVVVVESEERSTREEEELTEEVVNEVDSPGREPERANSLNRTIKFLQVT